MTTAKSRINADRTLSVRVIGAIPRSGSTLLMRAFREAEGYAITSRLVLMTNGSHHMFRPDYCIFDKLKEHQVYQQALQEGFHTLITKEELGHEKDKGECTYPILPGTDTYDMVKPIFLFRDPIQVFDSWKNVGWDDIESLTSCYKNLYKMSLAPDNAMSIIYEKVVPNPRPTLQNMCSFWSINFDENMLHFKRPLGDFLYKSDHERQIYMIDNPLGLFETVKSHDTIEQVISHGLLSQREIELLENEIGALYLDRYGNQLHGLRLELQAKTWFGFDLDDTLHEFRKASTLAASAVFGRISNFSGISESDIASTYQGILTQKTASAFTDGKSSTEYRKERFAALLDTNSLPYSDNTLMELAELYKSTLSVIPRAQTWRT